MSDQFPLTNSRFKLTFDQAPYSIQILSPDGRTIMVNKAFQTLMGLSDQFINDYILKEYNMLQDPLLEASGVMPLIRRAFAGEIMELPEVYYNPADLSFTEGRPTWTIGLFYPLKDEQGVVKEIVLMHKDVTRVHQANAENERLLQSQKFLAEVSSLLQSSLDYDQIVHQVASAAIPAIADGCIVDLREGNKIKRIITKHSDPEVEATMRKLQQQFPPDINSPQPTSVVMRTGEGELLENVDLTVILSHTINEKHAQLIQQIGVHSHIAVPVMIRGNIIGALNFLITTKRRKYDQLDLDLCIEVAKRAAISIENGRLYKEAKDAIKEREDFITIASHELKTPITSLKLQWEVATRTIHEGDKSIDPAYVKKLSSTSNRQLNRLTRLVEDMLDIAHITSGRLAMDKKPVDLAEIVTEVNDRFFDQLRDLKIDLKVGLLKPSPVLADSFRMEQVITNLMTNAIRYGQKKPIEVSLGHEENFALFEIKDQGRGIPKPDQQRIFERFVRAINVNDTSGLGLGLFISQQIVEEHQGQLSVASESEGSTFILKLPLFP